MKYPGLPTSGEIPIFQDDLTKPQGGGVGPGVCEGAQVKGKNGKQVGMIPGLTSGRREEDLAGEKHASVLGSVG